MNKNNFYNILLSLSAILFFVLYIILSFRNQYSADDNALLALVQEVGVMDAVIQRYYAFCARWSADTVAFSMIEWCRYKFFLPLFHILTLLALVCSFFLLLKRIFSIFFSIKISDSVLLLYAVILSCSFFFASYDIREVWFWYVSAWTYLWSIIAGNFLFWILLAGKIRWFHYPLFFILTAYIAGAAESYSLVYIFFLLALLFMKRKHFFPVLLNKIQNPLLLIVFIFLFLFFLLTFFAPGTWARKEILTHASFAEHCIMVMKAYGKIVLLQTPKLLPCLLLFGVPWMMLGEITGDNSPKVRPGEFVLWRNELAMARGQGTSSKSQIPSSKFQWEKKIRDLLYGFVKSILLLGFMILLLILPASWVLYDVPPARALSQVSLLLSLYAAFIFFYIGYKIPIPQKWFRAIVMIALIASVVVLSFHIYAGAR